MDVEFAGQLIDSMIDAVSRMDVAVGKGNDGEANELKVFIFDLHNKLNEVLKKDV